MFLRISPTFIGVPAPLPESIVRIGASDLSREAISWREHRSLVSTVVILGVGDVTEKTDDDYAILRGGPDHPRVTLVHH